MQEQMFLEEAESLDMGEGEEINCIGFIGLVHWHTLSLIQPSRIHHINSTRPEQVTSLIFQTKTPNKHLLCCAAAAH